MLAFLWKRLQTSNKTSMEDASNSSKAAMEDTSNKTSMEET
jgi:hypothetical protein